MDLHGRMNDVYRLYMIVVASEHPAGGPQVHVLISESMDMHGAKFSIGIVHR